ncbi:hypothetical protein [Paenibacillus lutrae]|uniref:Uncharacterized protein n=1 Tax=Paenibacillus lutrae TaxID=2078573 RepID=A0A7X3FMC2_9BACL|nr:hypothetical protein [Paenibacillus lutrae]MVP02119.1 hypothetical protein [Paenibacillus lutrae]
MAQPVRIRIDREAWPPEGELKELRGNRLPAGTAQPVCIRIDRETWPPDGELKELLGNRLRARPSRMYPEQPGSLANEG